MSATRGTTGWLHFLDSLETFTPPGDRYLIVGNPSLHWSVGTMLWKWDHPPIRASTSCRCLGLSPQSGVC
jgi:hypothetical protein